MNEKQIRDTFTITVIYDRLAEDTAVSVLAMPGDNVSVADATAALVAAIRIVPSLAQQQVAVKAGSEETETDQAGEMGQTLKSPE